MKRLLASRRTIKSPPEAGKEVKMKKTLLFIFMSLFLMQTPSYAAWMSGVVKEVDLGERMVTIERSGAQFQEAYSKELDVKILENAKLKNLASLDELRSGQEIKLDARANKEQGYWDANYVELIDADADASANETTDEVNEAVTQPEGPTEL